MTFTTVPLLATGDWIDAAWGNTYWKDNFAALWPFTAAGDLAYASSATALSRLAKPSVDSVLKNTSGGVPSWLSLASMKLATASLYNATGSTYSSTTERDLPNSSGSITPNATSTIVVVGRVQAANGVGNGMAQFALSIDGTTGNFTALNFGDGIGAPVVMVARKTGVGTGARTIKIREKEGYGAGVTYSVAHLEWMAVAIPE